MSNAHMSAFPTPEERSQYGEMLQHATYGLTKREYIATQIAMGQCANSIPGSHHVPENVARDSVQIADALLAELEK
jgi:hypothetical protein